MGDAGPDITHSVVFLCPFDVLVEILPVGPHIHEEDGGLHLGGVFLGNDGLFGGVHAADGGAVAPSDMRVPRSDALNPGHLLGMVAVRGPHHLALERSGGGKETFEFDARDDVGESPVTVFTFQGGLEFIKARREDDGADLDLKVLVLQFMVDGLGLTGLDTFHALGAPAALQAALGFLHRLFRGEPGFERFDHVRRGFPLFPDRGGELGPQG